MKNHYLIKNGHNPEGTQTTKVGYYNSPYNKIK